MPNYRRLRHPGGTYFFTVNLADRSSDLLIREISHLRDAVAFAKAWYPFKIDAFTVLPTHLHCVLTLPPGDADYSLRWNIIKGQFTRRVRASSTIPDIDRVEPTVRHDQPTVRQGRTLRPSHVKRREAGIWQRRFYEHTIRGEADYWNHVRYCWNNPVKHGYVERPEDWPYSSVHWDSWVLNKSC